MVNTLRPPALWGREAEDSNPLLLTCPNSGIEEGGGPGPRGGAGAGEQSFCGTHGGRWTWAQSARLAHTCSSADLSRSKVLPSPPTGAQRGTVSLIIALRLDLS